MGRVRKYRRANNGQAFVSYRGKRIQLGVYGSEESRVRYAEVLRRIESSEPEEPPERPSAGTVRKAIIAYLKYAESYYEGKRELVSMKEALRWVAPLASVSGPDFGPQKLLKIQQDMAASLARSTANHHLQRIKRWIKWSSLNGFLPEDTYARCLCVSGLQKGQHGVKEPKRVSAVSWAAVRPVLPFLTPQVADMVTIQFWAGMRPGEVCIMREADLDRSGAVWIYRPLDHKSSWRGSQLVKGIPPSIQEIVSRHFTGDPESYLFPTLRSPCHSPHSYRAAVMHAFDLWDAAREKEAAQAGTFATPATRWSPGQLRHGIATELQRVAGAEASSIWLGHASPSTTEAHYIERSVNGLLSVAVKVDELFSQHGS